MGTAPTASDLKSIRIDAYGDHRIAVTAYIPVTLREALYQRAKQNHRTITSELIAILEDVLRSDNDA